MARQSRQDKHNPVGPHNECQKSLLYNHTLFRIFTFFQGHHHVSGRGGNPQDEKNKQKPGGRTQPSDEKKTDEHADKNRKGHGKPEAAVISQLSEHFPGFLIHVTVSGLFMPPVSGRNEQNL
jgi:hypothetical protein